MVSGGSSGGFEGDEVFAAVGCGVVAALLALLPTIDLLTYFNVPILVSWTLIW